MTRRELNTRLSAALPYCAVIACITFLLPSCSSGPDPVDVEMQRARTAYQSDDLETAEDASLSAWKARPASVEVRAMVASVYRKQGRKAADAGDAQVAWQAFRNAAAYEPYRAKRARDFLAAVDAGELAGVPSVELADVATGAAQANPANPDARRSAARHLDNASRPKDALPHYLWIFEADPGDVRAALRLATIYGTLGEHDDAVVVYQRALQAEPKNVQASLGLAAAQEELGQLERAESTYEFLLANHDRNPGILFRFADFLDRRGQKERAERLREDARELLPGVERRDMRDLR